MDFDDMVFRVRLAFCEVNSMASFCFFLLQRGYYH